jgi:hypothetical protein
MEADSWVVLAQDFIILLFLMSNGRSISYRTMAFCGIRSEASE